MRTSVSAPRLLIEGCAVATVAGEEYESGYGVAAGGRAVVEGAELKTADETEISTERAGASRRLAERAEEVAL